MTYYYPQDNAYDIIQEDIEKSFYKKINLNIEDIKNIVIVGAYHGYEIKRLLNIYPNVTVWAFEAVPEHFRILYNNYKDNSRVQLYNLAVSNINGKVDFYELNNNGGGCGSLLKFEGNNFGHPYSIKEVLKLPCVTLKDALPKFDIDMLWVDTQGAELLVLKGAPLERCKSLFLEIKTKNYTKEWDKEPYKGQCFKEDLEKYLIDFKLDSIGLDNFHNSGQGNSFWIHNK